MIKRITNEVRSSARNDARQKRSSEGIREWTRI